MPRTSLPFLARIQAGRRALESRSWVNARREFNAALAIRESAEALEGLGEACWWLNDAANLFRAREGAYRLYRRRKDSGAAARLAVALAEDSLYFRGESAVAQGWHRRAHELLEDLDLSAGHGWLRLSEGDFALVVKADPRAASGKAGEALRIGRELGIDDMQIQARALEGAALVMGGRVSDGMEILDGAVTAALSGELDNALAIGNSCCYMLNACERARDFDRAMQWCGRVRQYSEQSRFDVLLAVCRIQRGGALIGRGLWNVAESELKDSAGALASNRPALRGQALLRLAGLRRLQGRMEESAQLLRQCSAVHMALLEEAALALERGSPRAAIQRAERFLRRLPKGNRTDRPAALEIILRAHLSLGNRMKAQAVVAELRALTSTQSGPLVGLGWAASGLLAASENDYETARRCFEDAIDSFQQSGAIHDAARGRMDLARVLKAAGQHQAAQAEAGTALAAFRELGASAYAGRTEGLLAELRRVVAQPDGTEPTDGLSRRETEVLRWVAQGFTNRVIAQRLHVSEFTVKRHVQNILTKLDLPTRAAASAYAARQGLL